MDSLNRMSVYLEHLPNAPKKVKKVIHLISYEKIYTVEQLSNAGLGFLLKLPGMGPSDILAISGYLSAQGWFISMMSKKERFLESLRIYSDLDKSELIRVEKLLNDNLNAFICKQQGDKEFVKEKNLARSLKKALAHQHKHFHNDLYKLQGKRHEEQ